MIKSVKAFFAGAGIGPSCELFGLAQIYRFTYLLEQGKA
jgi:hypothetical protein